MVKMVIGLAAFALTLTACNNNSQPTPGGMICSAGYNPIGQDLGPGLKEVPKKPEDNKSAPPDQQMKPGRYSYLAADIIYFGDPKKSATPAKLQLRDQATNGASVHQTVYCSENTGMKLEIPATEADVATDIVVCSSDFHQIVRSRKFKWSVVDGAITFEAPQLNTDKFCAKSGAEVYGKDDYKFVKDDDNNYEVRSHRLIGDGYFDLSSHMGYAPFPTGPDGKLIDPPECSKCEPPPTPPAQVKSNPIARKKDEGDNRRR